MPSTAASMSPCVAFGPEALYSLKVEEFVRGGAVGDCATAVLVIAVSTPRQRTAMHLDINLSPLVSSFNTRGLRADCSIGKSALELLMARWDWVIFRRSGKHVK